MLSGKTGIKYGLQIRSKPQQKKQQAVKAGAKNLPPPPSIFGQEEEDDIESEIAREALKKRSKREIEQQHAAALQQDASIFDYDAVYDEMKGAHGPKEEERSQRQSKYIGALLDKAKARQREQEIVHERLLSKERGKEDHLYGDKEKFVTRAYKEKLAEQARWLEEEKRREALEAANDVTKREDLSDFYRNLMKSNVALGGKGHDIPSGQAQAAPAFLSSEKGQGGPDLRRETDTGASPAKDELGRQKIAAGSERLTTSDVGAAVMEKGSQEEQRAREERPKKASAAAADPSPSPASRQPAAASAITMVDNQGPEDKAAAARERYLARKRQRA